MIKFILLLIYLVSDYGAIGGRLARIDTAQTFCVFGLLYAGLAFGLVTLGQMRTAWLRVPLALLLAAMAAVQIGYERATGAPLDYEAAVGVYLSRTAGDAALAHFWGAIGVGVALGGMLFVALALPPVRYRLASLPALIIPLLSFGLLLALIYRQGGTGARGMPPGYAALGHMLLYAAQDQKNVGSFRHKILPPPQAARVPQDIVLIVDESVGAHYLDVTRPEGVRSGLLRPPPSLRVVNYGHAAAISGCSVYSNYLLRFGGTQNNFATAAFQWPSIWAYARQAGFHTVYLEGQMGNGALQNMMQLSERIQIEDFVSISTLPMYLRDLELADLIARYSRNGRRDFIYVNKVGAHFPILNKYPPDHARYQPDQLRRRQADMWQAFSNPEGASWSPDQWARYRNGYRNALAWSVGTFFDRLLGKLEGQQSLILYTSDHGLALRERPNPGLATHCTSDVHAMEQGIVPLVIIGPKYRLGLDWAKAYAQNYNRATGFRIFPTMLLLMGYDRAAVRAHYGRPLDERPQDRFARIGHFNGLRTQKPDLVEIDLPKLVAPPMSDYVRPAFKRSDKRIQPLRGQPARFRGRERRVSKAEFQPQPID